MGHDLVWAYSYTQLYSSIVKSTEAFPGDALNCYSYICKNIKYMDLKFNKNLLMNYFGRFT